MASGAHRRVTRRGYLEYTDGGARVFLRVTPNASKNEITGEWRGEETPSGANIRLAVKVTAPPDKGKANAAIVKLLAKHFGVSKSSVTITAGETSRLKTAEIKGAKLSVHHAAGSNPK